MNTRYSPGTGAFYPADIDYGDRLPADVIKVEQKDFDSAMSRPRGHTFSFIGGKLVIAEPAPVAFSIIAEQLMAQLRADRAVILGRLPGFGFEALASGNKDRSSSVLAAIQALKSMPEDAAIVGAKNEEDLRHAIAGAFESIAAVAPEWLRSAFAK